MYDQEKFLKLQKAKEILEPEILTLTNVQGCSIGFKTQNEEQTDELAIIIHVYKKLPLTELSPDANVSEIIKKYDITLKSDVIESEEPEMDYLQVPDELTELMIDKDKYRPLKGGCEITLHGNHKYHHGTAGCKAHSKLLKGHTVILTCEHVVAKSEDDIVCQPLFNLVDSIGIVENKVCNAKVDCASVKLKNTESLAEIINIGAVKGTAAPKLNDLVRKRGYKTELTHGKITNVNYSGKIAERIVTNQIIISKINVSDPRLSDKGDSGSAWMLEEGNKVVGLHWAGGNAGANAYACLISEVENALNVEISTE